MATDPALDAWFLADGERGNPASGLRLYSCDNRVTPLVDGAGYFRRLADELTQTAEGDQIYFLDFRGDLDERLDGPGTEVGRLLSDAADRGVLVFGLLWRSQPRFLKQSEEANAEFVRHVADHGGQVHAGRPHPPRRQPPPEAGRHPAPGPARRRRRVRRRHRPRAQPSRRPPPRRRPAGDGLPDAVRPTARLARHPGRGARAGRPRPRAHLPGTLVRQQRPRRPEPGPSAVRPGLPRQRHDRRPAARSRCRRTPRRAAARPSRCCAPTRRDCAATRSHRSASGASPTPTDGPSRAPGGWSTWRTSTCGRRTWRGSCPRHCARTGGCTSWWWSRGTPTARDGSPRRRPTSGDRTPCGCARPPAATGSPSTTWRTRPAGRSTSTPRWPWSTTCGR